MTDANPLDSLLNRVHCLDCFELMARLPDKSIDAIISDLPYGTTSCHWDTIIPFAPMWDAVKRILKPRGVFVTTASQPFTSALVMSNPGWFKYSWVWVKSRTTDFIRAKYKPMGQHEDVLVFSKGGVSNGSIEPMSYYPQGLRQVNMIALNHKNSGGMSLRDSGRVGVNNNLNKPSYFKGYEGYPSTVLCFNSAHDSQHPTQKPVALYDYLIRTYTQPGEIVLDFCAGSGTTALAARQTGRRFIIGDSSPEYCAIAQKRLDAPYTLPMLELLGG